MGRLKLSLVIYFLIWFLFQINATNLSDLLFGFHLEERIISPAIYCRVFLLMHITQRKIGSTGTKTNYECNNGE